MRRTRQHLRDALVTLILEKGWDAVSVSDVCERADVGRSTFYVHFADKEDLLLSGFDDLHAALASLNAGSEQPFAFSQPLIEHAHGNERLFRSVIGTKSGPQMEWRFRDMVRASVEEELARLDVPKQLRATMARFIAGGFVDMLTAWLDRKGRVSAQSLAQQFRSFALGAAQASRRLQDP